MSLRSTGLCLVAFCLALGCRQAVQAPTVQSGPAGSAAALPVQADPAALRALLEQTTGRTARPFMTYDFGRARDSRAISVVVEESKAPGLVTQLRPRMPAGWLVFAGTDRWLGEEDHGDQVELVMAPGDDQFDILRLARSNAVNYDMMTEDLIRKLTAYDSAVGLEIFQANTDTVVARLKTLPPDLARFANDVYEFCPDVVDQGTGSVEALQAELRESQLLYLWWD